MIIDGHAHACGNYLTNESINQTLASNQVDYVVLTAGQLHSSKIYPMADTTVLHPTKDVVNNNRALISFVATVLGAAKQIPAGNDYVFNLKSANPKIKQFYWITRESLPDLERKYSQMRFEGVKIHQCWARARFDSPWFDELLQFIIAKDIPLFIHLGSPKEIDQIIRLTTTHNAAKIIIGHSIGLEKFIERKASLSPHIHFDVSNNYFVSSQRIQSAIQHFGAQRIVLGSDSPYGENSLALTIARVKQLDIAEADKAAILGGNLARLLKLTN